MENNNTQILTDKEIIEGNKLIAEFMGGKKNIYNISNAEYYSGLSNARNCLTSDLKYYSSWDWLMPVVEKIEKLGFDTCINNDFVNPHNKDQIYQYCGIDDSEKNISESCMISKIEAVWNAVTNFIKWYNQNKQ